MFFRGINIRDTSSAFIEEVRAPCPPLPEAYHPRRGPDCTLGGDATAVMSRESAGISGISAGTLCRVASARRGRRQSISQDTAQSISQDTAPNSAKGSSLNGRHDISTSIGNLQGQASNSTQDLVYQVARIVDQGCRVSRQSRPLRYE